jgi:hypothetical protein
MPVTHTIEITTSGRAEYRTSGAVAITASSAPLMPRGRCSSTGPTPSDLLKGVFDGVSISPASLPAITQPRFSREWTLAGLGLGRTAHETQITKDSTPREEGPR